VTATAMGVRRPALIRPGSGPWTAVTAEAGADLLSGAVVVDPAVLELVHFDASGAAELALATGDGVVVAPARVVSRTGCVEVEAASARTITEAFCRHVIPTRLGLPEAGDAGARFRTVTADIVAFGVDHVEVISTGAPGRHQLAVLILPLGDDHPLLLVERTATVGARFTYRFATADPATKAELATVLLDLVGRGLAVFPEPREAPVA